MFFRMYDFSQRYERLLWHGKTQNFIKPLRPEGIPSPKGCPWHGKGVLPKGMPFQRNPSDWHWTEFAKRRKGYRLQRHTPLLAGAVRLLTIDYGLSTNNSKLKT